MSGDIKYAIGLLCKQLNLIFNTNLKPEHFRLAKFDKTDENVVSVLWTTLSLLTTKQKQIDVEKIKIRMASLNYTPEFLHIPSENKGSRELLVAIGFIIAKSLPDLITEQIKQSPFDDSYSLIGLESIEAPAIPHPLEEENVKNYIKWLKGRIRQNKRMTEEYDSQRTIMYEKLNNLMNTKADVKLSLNEVLALSNKKFSEEFLDKCSYIMEVLECYQEWTRKQKVFWKWMATVLAERQGVFDVGF